jgi:hypothetical protein
MNVKQLIEKWQKSPNDYALRLTRLQYAVYVDLIHHPTEPVNVITDIGILHYHNRMGTLKKAIILYSDRQDDLHDLFQACHTSVEFWEAHTKPCFTGTWIEITNEGVGRALPHLLANVQLSGHLSVTDWHKAIRFAPHEGLKNTLAWETKISKVYSEMLGLEKHKEWCVYSTQPLSLCITLDQPFQKWILENIREKKILDLVLGQGLITGEPFFPPPDLSAGHLDTLAEKIIALRVMFKQRSKWFIPVERSGWIVKLEAEERFCVWLRENLKDEVWSTEPCVLRSSALKDLINGGRGWAFITEAMMWASLPELDKQMDKLFVEFQTKQFKWCVISGVKGTLRAQVKDKLFRDWLKKNLISFDLTHGSWANVFTFTVDHILSGDVCQLSASTILITAKQFDEKLDALYEKFQQVPHYKITFCKLSAIEVDVPTEFVTFIHRSTYAGVTFHWSLNNVSEFSREGENKLWTAIPKPRLASRHTVLAYGPPELMKAFDLAVGAAWSLWLSTNPTQSDSLIPEAVTEKEEGVRGVKIESLGDPTIYARECNLQGMYDQFLLSEPGDDRPKMLVL